MTSDQLIQGIVAANPTITAKALAEESRLSRQTVYEACKRLGITLQDGRRTKVISQPANTKAPKAQLSPNLVGAASEMTVCADLLRRGWPTYRACAATAAAAVIAEIGGKLHRIEVRTAQRQGNALRYGMPKNDVHYDILALVDPEGHITYKPAIESAHAIE